jgi:hypothetical protein
VYEYYYLKIRDYVHALVSMTTFLLIVLFTNPISMWVQYEQENGVACLFGSSRLVVADASPLSDGLHLLPTSKLLTIKHHGLVEEQGQLVH